MKLEVALKKPLKDFNIRALIISKKRISKL